MRLRNQEDRTVLLSLSLKEFQSQIVHYGEHFRDKHCAVLKTLVYSAEVPMGVEGGYHQQYLFGVVGLGIY